MPVPSSGQLRLRADINLEINGNDTDTNVSLGTLSDDASFDAPDAMSDFYGYTSCSTPTQVEMNILGSASPSGFFARGRYTGSNGGCDVNSYGFYMGTNSSGPTANTKYEIGTDNKGIYSVWDKTFSGLNSSTTYYIWVYVSNVAGYTGYSPMYSRTTQAPYVPLSSYTLTPSGDWSGANYCPNYNFNGGYSVNFTNTTSTTYFDIYGDGNFYHASSQQYNGCIYTYGAFPADSSPRNFTASLNSQCYDYSTCGTTRTLYGKFRSSGYTDVVYSSNRACPAC